MTLYLIKHWDYFTFTFTIYGVDIDHVISNLH